MPKYEGINPFEKLHPGEPWFFIRAQDRLSVEAVKRYAALLQETADQVAEDGSLGPERSEELAMALDDQASEVAEFAFRFAEWQKQHPEKVKYPD